MVGLADGDPNLLIRKDTCCTPGITSTAAFTLGWRNNNELEGCSIRKWTLCFWHSKRSDPNNSAARFRAFTKLLCSSPRGSALDRFDWERAIQTQDEQGGLRKSMALSRSKANFSRRNWKPSWATPSNSGVLQSFWRLRGQWKPLCRREGGLFEPLVCVQKPSKGCVL